MVSEASAWRTRVWSESIRTKNWRRVGEDDRGRAEEEGRGEAEESEEEEEGREAAAAVWSLRILVGFIGRTASSA